MFQRLKEFNSLLNHYIYFIISITYYYYSSIVLIIYLIYLKTSQKIYEQRNVLQ